MRIFLAAMALAGTPADRFNLVCSSAKGAEHYRIDLNAALWCLGDCSDVKKIADVTPTKLTLTSEEPRYRTDEKHLVEIDRMTGAWYKVDRWYIGGIGPDYIIEGHCEAAPFSGFPTAQKF